MSTDAARAVAALPRPAVTINLHAMSANVAEAVHSAYIHCETRAAYCDPLLPRKAGSMLRRIQDALMDAADAISPGTYDADWLIDCVNHAIYHACVHQFLSMRRRYDIQPRGVVPPSSAFVAAPTLSTTWINTVCDGTLPIQRVEVYLAHTVTGQRLKVGADTYCEGTIIDESVVNPQWEIVSTTSATLTGVGKGTRQLLGTRSTKNREKNRCFYQISHHSVSPTTSEPNSNHGGGAPPPPHPPRLTKHFYCFDLTSREPKNTVFQQNPTVQQAQLDAPMYSDALNAAAQSSIHLLKLFFSVCRDLVVTTLTFMG